MVRKVTSCSILTPKAVRRPAVWIVDDNPLEREHARRALAADFETELFADGSAVLERLATAARPTCSCWTG